MTKTNNSDKPQETTSETKPVNERRALLKKLGRFAAVTAPAVTLILAAGSKPAKAEGIISGGGSSRAFKTRDGEIDTASVLAGVTALPVDAWRHKPETGLEQRSHIGPYVEDFQKAFGVGDGVTISSIDAIGVCLAAIKALSAKVESLEEELQATHPRKAA